MFNFKSKRELLRYLGQLDGLVQLNEIALRKFQASFPNKEDLKHALMEGSADIQVKVSYIEWPDFFDRFYRELINSIYSSFEKFYDLHWSDLQVLFPEKFEKKHQEEQNKLLRIYNYYISVTGQKPAISENTISVFNYYHRLRNDTVHPERADHKKTLKKYEAINLEAAVREFSARPNMPDSICFADYLLFSKVVKKICVELSDNITPSSENIIELIPKKLLGEQKSLGRKVSEFLRREYGLDKIEIETILSSLKTR